MLTRRSLALAAVLFAGSVAADPPVPDFKIEAIELSHFNADTGALTPLPEDGFNLFGDLLVKVKVTGPKGVSANGRQVVIELAGLKLPAQKREVNGIGADGATFVLAYFPTGIICSPMTVKAKLQGQKAPATKELKLTAFDCGE